MKLDLKSFVVGTFVGFGIIFIGMYIEFVI